MDATEAKAPKAQQGGGAARRTPTQLGDRWIGAARYALDEGDRADAAPASGLRVGDGGAGGRDPRVASGEEAGWYSRMTEIAHSTFVANGDRDGLFPAIDSVVLAREIANSQLAIYPDSGHAFLFEHADRFAGDVPRILGE